jgi:[ribosomal protein S5]-alanine N-acetyltransferase
MQLQTELTECCIRRWQPEDKAALIRHANNRNVWRNLTDMFPHPYTREDAEAWIVMASIDSASTHRAIEFRGEAVGGVGIIASEGIYSRTGQLGYWVGEAHWGRGIATAAARALVAQVLSEPDIVRLEAPVFAWNQASMRVLEKAGFIKEGIRRKSVFKDGQIIDSVMYALVREV